MPTIRMRATYMIHTWPDEPDTYPDEESGYTDPRNPWGGFRDAVPDDLIGEAFARWRDENAAVIEFDSVEEAAQFVADFPGGVWDWEETEWDRLDDGRDMEVTLHLVNDDDKEAVFAAADKIRAAENAKIKEYRNRA